MNEQTSERPKINSAQKDIFCTTAWTRIMAIQKESPEARQATEDLCRSYWMPLYAFVRHRGFDHNDAEDLTQGFFHFFLANRKIQIVDRQKGKFRAFLLAALKGFIANEWNRQHALKRGGGAVVISLDEPAPQEGHRFEPVTHCTPDQAFERSWASTIFDRALQQVKQDCENAGKSSLFNELKCFLVETTDMSAYGSVAQKLDMTPNTVAVNVHRLRQRYRHFLRQEVARTVGSEEEIEEELRHLFATALESSGGL